MPVFEYTGVDANSKKVSGVVDAESDKAARAKLRKQRIYPTKLVQEGTKKGFNIRLFNKVTVEEVAGMTRQMAVLLGANIPLIDSIAATLDQVENQDIRKALAEIKERVSEGARLGDCMMNYPKIFDNIYIYMVKAGEASGSLDVVLQRLADFKEAQAELKAKIASAMYYPVFMLVVAALILAYIFTYVVPKITKMFVKQKLTLPWYTQLVMKITEFLTTWQYVLILIGVIALLVFLFVRYKNSPKGREQLDRWRLRLYVFGELNQKVAVARFAKTLSTLLSSGVQLLPALDIVRNVMDNVVLSKIIEDTMLSVKEGESLADPLRRSGRFPSMFIHMIVVGEKTGLLEQMLEKVADTYDKEVNTFIDGMTSLLTPVMLVVMGLTIGFIVVSVMAPIFQLMQK